MTKRREAAVEGWFTVPESEGGPGPALLGSRCTTCGGYAFPAETVACRNPDCAGDAFESVELSRRGTIWSYTNACYTPPTPYVAADPFVPFCVAAVQLDAEQMVVMGQVVPGVTVDDLHVGQPVELVLDPLYEDDDKVALVYKWKPVPEGAGGEATSA